MSWAKWDAEHPNHHKEGEGGERSADKLAAMIKATVGNHEGVRAEVRPHGSGGSVVHKTTKADLKRPVQPKGHKDRGDSARTTIRMAAHYRGKRGEQVGPTGEIKPEAGNTGKLRSADRLVAARDDRPKAAEHEPIKVVPVHKQGEEPKSSAQKLADQMAERPTADRARQHYQMVADRAKKATDTARTSKDYDEAAQLHRRAAELAPTENHRTVHEKLADTHERLAENERKGEALAADRKKTEDAARAAAAKKADDERKAAQARLAARSADMHAARVAREGGGGAAAKPAKTAALTTQNVHKAMAEAGLERTPKVKPSYDHMGRVLHRPTGRTAGRYDVRKEYDGSHTVDIHVGGGSYGVSDSDRAAQAARVEKATQAMQARGWKVKKDDQMGGRLRVSKPEEAPARSADKLAAQATGSRVEKTPHGTYTVEGPGWSVRSAQNMEIRNKTGANKIAGYHSDISKVVADSGVKGHVPLNIHQNGDVFHDQTGKKIGHIQTPGEKRAAEEAARAGYAAQREKAAKAGEKSERDWTREAHIEAATEHRKAADLAPTPELRQQHMKHSRDHALHANSISDNPPAPVAKAAPAPKAATVSKPALAQDHQDRLARSVSKFDSSGGTVEHLTGADADRIRKELPARDTAGRGNDFMHNSLAEAEEHHSFGDEHHLLVARDKSGKVAAVMSVQKTEPDMTGSERPSIHIDDVGSNGSVPGAGAKLAVEAAKIAHQDKIPVTATYADKDAAAFWHGVGFHNDPTGEGLDVAGWNPKEVAAVASTKSAPVRSADKLVGARDARGRSTEQEIEAIQRDHPGVSLSVTRSASGHLVIHKIVVPKEGRSQGTGSSIMKRITDAADRNGDKLALTPSKDFGGSVSRLKTFYGRHGFKPKEKSDFSTRETMVREPKRSSGKA